MKKKSILSFLVTLFLLIFIVSVYSYANNISFNYSSKNINIIENNNLEVSKITIFDGNTGMDAIITDEKDINKILEKFTNVTYTKEGSAKGFFGFSFATQIYDKNNKIYKSFIFYEDNVITYNDYFYKSNESKIDSTFIDFVENLFNKNIEISKNKENTLTINNIDSGIDIKEITMLNKENKEIINITNSDYIRSFTKIFNDITLEKSSDSIDLNTGFDVIVYNENTNEPLSFSVIDSHYIIFENQLYKTTDKSIRSIDFRSLESIVDRAIEDNINK